MSNVSIGNFFKNEPINPSAFAEFVGLPSIPEDFDPESFLKLLETTSDPDIGIMGDFAIFTKHLKNFRSWGAAKRSSFGELTSSILNREFESVNPIVLVENFNRALIAWLNDYVLHCLSGFTSERTRCIFIHTISNFLENYIATSLLANERNLGPDFRSFTKIESFGFIGLYSQLVIDRLKEASPNELGYFYQAIPRSKIKLHVTWFHLYKHYFENFCKTPKTERNVFTIVKELPMEEMFRIILIHRRAEAAGLGDVSYSVMESIFTN